MGAMKYKTGYKNIVFDCDSTLTKIEGLDEIARRKGLLDRVREITAAGMNGDLLFSQSLRNRLEIIQPSLEDLKWLGQRYVEELVSDATVVIDELKIRGLNIFILTGALLPAVEVLADYLKIDRANVSAVGFRGVTPFQRIIPINLDTFKVNFVQQIKKTGSTVLVGDGLVDYEAGKSVDLFIGFGGVVRRERLKELSSIYVEEPRLQPILDIVL